MTRYTVEFSSAAAKQVRKLDRGARTRVLRALSALAEEPRPAGVKKLVGADNAWRIRIGEYRAIYEIDDGVLTVVVFRVGHRREVYD